MNEISGYILAGGASTRMGRPKQLLTMAGRSLMDIGYENLRRLCSQVSIVVKEALHDSPYRQVYDVAPAGTSADGPLVAICTALSDTTTEWNFVLACDLPLVTSELLDYIASRIDGDTDAIIALQPDGRAQPLCGLYRRSSCLRIAERELLVGKRSPMALLEKVETRFIAFADYEHLYGSTEFFINVNAPEDYERAVRSFEEIQLRKSVQ